MKLLDLYSGIGGFSLGLEKAGMETIAFCEIEKYPQKVLAKHWPDVPIANDVTKLTYKDGVLYDDGNEIYKGAIDVICGGFPCQDISVAGNQKGIGEGTRSGLWSECARLLREIRPKYAIFENVTALLSGEQGRWFQRVLWDISEVGYDAEWHCIPASELGAHHHRDRVWIVAYADSANSGDERGTMVRENELMGGRETESNNDGDKESMAYSNNNGPSTTEIRKGINERGDYSKTREKSAGQPSGLRTARVYEDVADTKSIGTRKRGNGDSRERSAGGFNAQPNNCGTNVSNSQRIGQSRQGQFEQSLFAEAYRERQTINAFSGGTPDIWKAEPQLGRVANGIPDRSHRLKCLGNAVVPQIPEIIGRAIMEAES